MLSCGCCRYAVYVVCLQWLINTYESIVISKDTGYSDMLSEVLLTLHSASDITSKNSGVHLFSGHACGYLLLRLALACTSSLQWQHSTMIGHYVLQI